MYLNNKIPLTLWKLSVDYGFCWKIWLQICQEKPSKTASFYLGLIRGPLKGDIMDLNVFINLNTAIPHLWQGVHTFATAASQFFIFASQL